MKTEILTRRMFLAGGAASLALPVAASIPGLLVSAQAQGLAPTPTMRGGSNYYMPNAPIVERIGSGGFTMTGTVRRAGDGAYLPRQRIQMWAHTTEGYERDPHSHGATLTDENGFFKMDMPQIVPAFGVPHAHLAYDSGDFETVFLRPIMKSAEQNSLHVDFVLVPA